MTVFFITSFFFLVIFFTSSAPRNLFICEHCTRFILSHCRLIRAAHRRLIFASLFSRCLFFHLSVAFISTISCIRLLLLPSICMQNNRECWTENDTRLSLSETIHIQCGMCACVHVSECTICMNMTAMIILFFIEKFRLYFRSFFRFFSLSLCFVTSLSHRRRCQYELKI